MNTRFKWLATSVFLSGVLSALPASAQSVDWAQIIGAILGGQNTQQNGPNGNVGTCGSTNGRSQTCSIPNGYRAEFVRQVSSAACINGRTMFINVANVTVTQGCRAEFRLVSLNGYPGNGGGQSGLPYQTERAIESALRTQMRPPNGEYNRLSDVRIINARSTPIRGGTAVNGLAQSIWGNRTYSAEFDTTVDNYNRVGTVNYRYTSGNGGMPGGNWSQGTVMTNVARNALERAIEADIRRQSRVSSVQVKTNISYQQQPASRNEYYVRGKYGVSINDGNWQTRNFEARIRTGSSSINDLRTDDQP
ncbi:DUF3011 domain-containing protein [Lysobacter sp. HDW10]|uniref:DUF3011 domain-containing protein n=1 Tax=Lysobacter sp. HDW10 TaxID=2714936 RepID=UPI0014092B1D|nr:DUF3011 domain-containing protein [Lysobacter sp. HDW10]QIK81707.1 DUF3011 domain-containing protein [Lysobacter sp. HDW10]